ncbi:MAG TPA: hypothetical protein VKU41_01190 [Polyangiaceae bacterium]|nr:hypothetical protein [Polyangiaceae bacterium]
MRLREGVLAALVALLGAYAAHAEDAAPPATAPRAVQVSITGGAEEGARVADTIRELIGRLGLPIDAHVSAAAPAAAPAGSYVARAEVDLTSPASATVVVYGRTGEVVLRQTFARDASPSVVREEVADAVRSAVEAQLYTDSQRQAAAASSASSAPTTFTPPEPPPPASAAPAPAPAPAPALAPEGPSPFAEAWRRMAFALDVTALAGGGSFATGSEFVPRVGGAVVLAARRGIQPSLALSGYYVPPFDTQGAAGVTAHALVSSYRALVGVRVLRASWAALDASAGGGFDVLNVDPYAPPVATRDFTMRTDAILSVAVVGHAALAPGVALTLALGGDADVIRPRSYGVQTGTAETDVLAPWPVRPTAMAGLTFTALGERRFARSLIR